MLNLTSRGEQAKCEGGKAVRDTRKGQGRFDLIPGLALWRVANWYGLGARKYAARNWEKGMKYGRYLDSALRHIFKHLAGCRAEDHLAAAAWNLLGIIHTEEQVIRGLLPKSLDDLPCHVTDTERQDGMGGPLAALLKHYEQTIPKGDDHDHDGPITTAPIESDNGSRGAANHTKRTGVGLPPGVAESIRHEYRTASEQAVGRDRPKGGSCDCRGLDAGPERRRGDLPVAVQIEPARGNDTPGSLWLRICRWRRGFRSLVGRDCR